MHVQAMLIWLRGNDRQRHFARRGEFDRIAEQVDHNLTQPSRITQDDFRQINNRFGHAAGDAALRGVADRLSSVVRGDDVACRMGGAADEFGVLLHEATIEDAHRLYNRLRKALDEEPIQELPPITLSAGIARMDADCSVSTLPAGAAGRLPRPQGCSKRSAPVSGGPNGSIRSSAAARSRSR